MALTTQQVETETILRLNTQAPHYKWLVAGVALLAAGTQTFAGNSITLAIPRIMAAFGTDLATTQWVSTGFLIARTLVIPLLGWLGGLLGHRNLFVASLVGFLLTTTGCGLATSIPMLVGFRLLQGLCIGPMGGLTSVILMQAFPLRQRGLSLGLRALGTSSGQIISFMIGGYLIEQVSWRLIFFLGIPTGLTAAVLGLLVLPQHREARGTPVDYRGLLSLGGFLVPLLLAISLARNSETATSTLVVLGLSALSSGGVFILWELRTAFPAVNLRLFRAPAFRCICSTAFFNSLGLFTAQFMIPIFLQQMMGFTPLQVGLMITPALVIAGLSGVVVGRLSDLVPPPILVIGGLMTLMGVFYSLSSVTVMTTVGVLLGIIILYRICMHTVSTPLTSLSARLLEADQVRMGQGLLGLVRNIGASFGVTVASVLFERRRTAYQLLTYHTYDSSSPAHLATLQELRRLLHDAGVTGAAVERTALRAIQRQIDTEAIAAGFHGSFLFACACFLLAILPMVLILSRGWHRRTR